MNFAKSCCSKQMILVEGNIDVISLHQAGFCNTVAALGTSFTEEQARLLGRYTKEVVITLDADAAGEKATDRAMKILDGVGVEARVLRLPECKDPDEYIKSSALRASGHCLRARSAISNTGFTPQQRRSILTRPTADCNISKSMRRFSRA